MDHARPDAGRQGKDLGTSARVLTGVAATLALAAGCWVVFLTRMDSLALVPAAALMMGAMMLPSAVPLVAGQASRPAGAMLMVAIYLAMWTAGGAALFELASLLPMATLLVALLAIAVAAAYGLTPMQHRCRARCQALCRDSASPMRVGLEYGLNCVGCSAGVMGALVVVGPMNPLWILLATGAVAFYKMPMPRVAIS